MDETNTNPSPLHPYLVLDLEQQQQREDKCGLCTSRTKKDLKDFYDNHCWSEKFLEDNYSGKRCFHNTDLLMVMKKTVFPVFMLVAVAYIGAFVWEVTSTPDPVCIRPDQSILLLVGLGVSGWLYIVIVPLFPSFVHDISINVALFVANCMALVMTVYFISSASADCDIIYFFGPILFDVFLRSACLLNHILAQAALYTRHE